VQSGHTDLILKVVLQNQKDGAAGRE